MNLQDHRRRGKGSAARRLVRALARCFALLALVDMGVAAAATCGVTDWSSVQGAIVAAPAMGPGSVPRYSDECGLKATAPGQFVTDERPAAESRYAARFYVLSSTLAGVETTILESQSGPGAMLARVTYDGAVFRFYGNGSAQSCTLTGVSNRWHVVEFKWRSGNPGQLDCRLSYLVMNAQGGAMTTLNQSIALNNPADRLERTRLGFISGSGGTIYLDAFASRRDDWYGRLCRCDANGDGAVNSGDGVVIRNEFLQVAIAKGQPDCNDDGSVNSGDGIVARNLFLNGFSTCPTP